MVSLLNTTGAAAQGSGYNHRPLSYWRMIHYGPAYAQLSTCTFVYDEDDLIEWGPKSEAGPRSHESLLSVAKRAETRRNARACKSRSL